MYILRKSDKDLVTASYNMLNFVSINMTTALACMKVGINLLETSDASFFFKDMWLRG